MAARRRSHRRATSTANPTGSRAGMPTSNHHQCQASPLIPPPVDADPDGVFCPGTCRPESAEARFAGSVLNVFFVLFQEIWPPVNFWVTTSLLTVLSPTGAPSLPVAPRSLSHAAQMAPRTTNAPWSEVQKITGWSLAENGLTRLAALRPPSASLAIGKPRSLPPGPPSASYFVRMSVSTALAPVAGLKKSLPPAKFCASPSVPTGYWSPCLAPSGPDALPAARQAILMAAVGSMGTCRPVS